MIKKILILINFVALGIAVYWGYTEKFKPEQWIAIIGLVATLIALIFDRIKSSFVSQTMKVKGNRNTTEQHVLNQSDININQASDIEGNENKNIQHL